MRYNYIRPEDIDWFWDFDKKNKSHKLTLTYLPTKQSVVGEVFENKIPRGMLQSAKHDLQEDLREKLEDLIF